MTADTKFSDSIINNLSGDFQEFVKQIFNSHNVITNELAQKICVELKIDLENLIVMILPLASEFAYVPVSNFKVGAAVLCGSGNIYLGSNMEFRNSSINYSVHAEQSAVNNAWINGEKLIKKIAVTSAPCGHCRQYLNELNNSKNLQILLRDQEKNNIEIFELNQLLPKSFGPADLNIKDALMNTQNHNLKFETANDDLLTAALDAANKSYAPYTRNYSGAAVKLNDGSIYSGRYSENAAYNPSLSPLLSALSNMNMNCLLGIEKSITDAVLIESITSVSQKQTAEVILASISDLELRYYKI